VPNSTKIWNKYDNGQLKSQKPLSDRKVSTEALSPSPAEVDVQQMLRDHEKATSWAPLDVELGSKAAPGEFNALADHVKCKDDKVTFSFSGDIRACGPVVALIAKAAGEALAPPGTEKGKEAEIGVEGRFGPTSAKVRVSIAGVTPESAATVRERMYLVMNALYARQPDEAKAALMSEAGRAVLSSLRPDQEFEPTLKAFQAYLNGPQEKPLELKPAPKLGTIDASYLGPSLLPKQMVAFKFECSKAARPILERIVQNASGWWNPHQGSDAKATWNAKGGNIRFYRGDYSEEEVVALGDRVGRLVATLWQVDVSEVETAFDSQEGLHVLNCLGPGEAFEPALTAWKERLAASSGSE
jgi:hypothetical protein